MLESVMSTAPKKDCHCQEPPPNLFATLPEIIPSPEAMAAELDQALETEFLASGAASSGGNTDHFAALVQILQQYPGIKITLSA
jgi:hypothetical protein